MTIEHSTVSVTSSESVSRTVKVYVPEVVGVPEIVPVSAPKLSPGGSATAEIA